MRLLLYLKVYLLRLGSQLNAWLDRTFTSPHPAKLSFSTTIPTHRAARKGKLTLYFYTPPGYQNPVQGSSSSQPHPIVVNFHGGGFTIGNATDDARLAHAITSATNAVFVSVGYRKGPEHPAPTAALDAADAIEWLWAHANEYSLDASRTVTSGSSAGGNLCLGAPLTIYEDRQKRTKTVGNAVSASSSSTTTTPWSSNGGAFVGILAFYPSVDQTISRAAKAASNPLSVAHGSMSPSIYALFDDSYYTSDLPPGKRQGVALNPGLAEDDSLLLGFPPRLALYSCEYDQLLVETEDMRKRLGRLGKVVDGYVVEKVPHGFDKLPGNSKKFGPLAVKMREDAVAVLKGMLGA